MFVKKVLFLIILLCSFLARAEIVETSARNAIIVDLTNDAILYEKNADELFAPASMSKMMTAYVVFDLLKKKELSLDQMVTVPQEAYDRGGVQTGSSSMRLQPGQSVTIDNLLQGLLTASGNDAAITLATLVSGSESKFAELMTLKAKELSLQGHFANASGWSDPGQHMTARDLAILTQRIIQDFPEYFPLFSQKEFTFNGITHQNRNWLIQNRTDIDGMKTGYTSEAGYCVTVTAIREGRRLVVVVGGTKSPQERIDEAEKLLDWGYNNYDWNWFFAQGQELATIDVLGGSEKEIKLQVQQDLRLFLSQQQALDISSYVTYLAPLQPPISQGEALGRVIVRDNVKEITIASIPLVSDRSVEELTGMKRLTYHWRYWKNQGEK